MPRNPIRILKDPAWTQVLTSDFFLLALLDFSAYMVWPAFEVKARLESFSGYDPLWRLARAIQLWEEAYEVYTENTPLDYFRMLESTDIPWVPLDNALRFFASLGYRAIDRHNLCPVIDAVKEMRCIEDYDDRNSRAKIDFYRQWYHTKTKHPIVSLDAMIDAKGYDARADALDQIVERAGYTDMFEEELCERMDAQNFYKTELTDREREILTLRNYGLTQKEVAKQLQYDTHSAVGKRVADIVKRFGDYMDECAGKRIYMTEQKLEIRKQAHLCMRVRFSYAHRKEASINDQNLFTAPVTKSKPRRKCMQSYKSYDDLPLTLNPTDVANALGISRVNAYNLCHAQDFPAIRLGKRILIPKDRFLEWLNRQNQVCAN